MTRLYTYRPVGMDRYYNHAVPLEEGTVVRKIQPHGCPRNGTMGMVYVETETGEFVGLRLVNSLIPLRRA